MEEANAMWTQKANAMRLWCNSCGLIGANVMQTQILNRTIQKRFKILAMVPWSDDRLFPGRRYNVYDRAPLCNLQAEKADEFYRHYMKLGEIIDEMEQQDGAWFKLQKGELVLFDNFRLLHARKAFTGKRVMVSAYVPHGDYMSVSRSLGLIPWPESFAPPVCGASSESTSPISRKGTHRELFFSQLTLQYLTKVRLRESHDITVKMRNCEQLTVDKEEKKNKDCVVEWNLAFFFLSITIYRQPS